MRGVLRQSKAAWYVWSSRSQPVELRTLRGVGSRLRLVTGVWKSTGKPSVIFVLNKENDLTVYRCCWNKYNLLEFMVTFWSYICSTEFMCLWSISMLKGTPHSSQMGFPGGSVVKNLPASACLPQEMLVRPLGQKDPLKKGMATHSSILAWEIPGTVEPDRLQSIGSQIRTRLSN